MSWNEETLDWEKTGINSRATSKALGRSKKPNEVSNDGELHMSEKAVVFSMKPRGRVV